MTEDNFPALGGQSGLFYSILQKKAFLKLEKSGTELSFFEDQTRASIKLNGTT